MAGISITLAGNFQKLDELRDKAQKTAGSIKSAFKSVAGNAMFQGVAAGATVAFAGVVAAVSKAIDAGGDLADMMARTGASGKGLLILQRAFENAGMAASQVPSVLNKLQKALTGVNEEGEPTNEAFAKLGLSIADLTEMDPGDALMKIGTAISSIESPAQRTARSMEIFGKSGGELLAIFNDPAAFSGAQEQLGGIADLLPGMAGDADAVGDAFGALDEKMKQFGVGVLEGVMPQLLEFSKWINETDFTGLGQDVVEATKGLLGFSSILAQITGMVGLFQIGEAVGSMVFDSSPDQAEADKMAADQAANDPEFMKARKLASETNQLESANASFWQAKEAEKQAAVKKRADIEAAAAAKQAKADNKAAAAQEKSRAAAMEEYNLDSAILSARLRGDAEQLASLEREKKIREEIARLTSAGFTAIEARKPAEAKVDAEKKAADKEDAASKAEEERKKIEETLQGKLKDVQGRQQGQEFQSSIGAISSMQRIGGGGGAVSSGLDYARTAADLQREANTLIRQLIDVIRPEVDA